MTPSPSAAEAVSYLIAASGNSRLASERASQALHTTVTEAQLLTVISSDPSAISQLAGQVKVFALLHSLEAFKLTHMLYLERLDSLPATAAAKTYTELISALGRLGLPSSQTPDAPAIDQVLRLLPPEVADALESFNSALSREPETAPSQRPGNATLPVTSEPPDTSVQVQWEVPPRR